MKVPRWSQAEREALVQLAIDVPADRLPAAYNQWAAAEGFPKRSLAAIRGRLNRSRVSDKASGDWVSAGYICRVLGVGKDTTQRWTNRYGIPCHQDGRRRRYFLRSDLRKVASKRPAIFGGIPADRLFLLLEDRELADHIAAHFTRRGRDPRPVRAVETGWWYESIRAAAARAHVARQAIQYAIRTGGTAAGYHWTYA